MRYIHLLFLSVCFIQFGNLSFAQEKSEFAKFVEQHSWLPFKEATGKWSFRSVDGEQLKGLLFDSLTEFSNSDKYKSPTDFFVAQVKVNNKWGVIDHEGKFIVPMEYETLKITFPQIDNGLIEAEKIDKNGNNIKDYFNFDGAKIDLSKYCFCELSSPNNEQLHTIGYPYFMSSYYFTYKHLDGWRTLHCSYDDARKDVEVVSMTGKTLLDTSIVHAANYHNPGNYTINNEKILNNEIITSTWILYDQSLRVISSTDGSFLLKGKDTIIPPGIYSKIEAATYPSSNTEPVLRVQKNGLWGLVDGTGEILMEPQFESVFFQNGLGGTGRTSDKVILFDTLFQKIDLGKHNQVSWVYLNGDDEINPKSYSNFFLALSNGKYGIITKDQEILIPQIWSNIDVFGTPDHFYFRAENADEKTVAFYDSKGKLLFKKKKILYQPRAMSHCWAFSDKKSTIIFNAMTGKIIKKKIQTNVELETIVTERYRNLETDVDQFYNFAGVYLKGKGWEIIDNNGNTLISAKHPECNALQLVVKSDTLWGTVYSKMTRLNLYSDDYIYKPVSSSIETKDHIVIPSTPGKLGYDAGLLYGYKDSIYTFYSMNGKVLKSEKVDDDYGSPRIFTTNPDSIYFQYIENNHNFYDVNLNPIFTESFQSIDFNKNNTRNPQNLIGKGSIKGKQYLLILKDSLFASRPYDELVCNSYSAYGKYGELTDLYDQNGDLIFAECQKFEDHETYFTLEKDGKKYWTNKAYKIYMITNL